MRNAYRANIISQHIEAAKKDEYYHAQLTGSAGKPINLDEEDLILLKKHYENEISFKNVEEVIASRDKDNYVEGYVMVHISDLIDNNLEGFLDIISEKLVGSDLLMDINYEIVGYRESNTLILKVSGDVSNIIDKEE